MTLTPRRSPPTRRPRRDHAADHAVHADGELDLETRRAARRLAARRGIATGSRSAARRASRVADGRRADRGDARRRRRDRRPRPVPAGHRQRPHGRDARADRRGAALGASGALVVAPYYARPQPGGPLDWYSRVASEFPDMPIIVYNVPIRSAVDIAPETVGALRRSTTTSSASRRRRATSSTSPTCCTSAAATSSRCRGSSCSATRCSCLGGRGHLSCVANFAPEPVAELYDAFVAGDHERARQLHYELHALVDAAFVEVNPVPAKWIMGLGIMPSAFAREPLAPLGEAGARRSGAAGARLSLSGSPPNREDAPRCGWGPRLALLQGAEALDRVELVAARRHLDLIGRRVFAISSMISSCSVTEREPRKGSGRRRCGGSRRAGGRHRGAGRPGPRSGSAR